MSRRLQSLLAVLLAGLWGASIYFGHAYGYLAFLDQFEANLADLRTTVRGVKAPPDSLTIVEIDDALARQVGSYPLPRRELARLVRAVAQLKPSVIAVDILLLDKGSDEGDEALAAALDASPAVIAAAAVFSESRQSVDVKRSDDPLAHLPIAERFLLPQQRFSDHAQIGIVNLNTDRTGTPRSVPLLFRTSGSVELSFPLRVAAVATGHRPTIEPGRLTLGGFSLLTDSDYAIPIAFHGPRRTIRTIAAGALLDGTADPRAIANRIVVLGATVTGGGDFFSTPFEPVMPGLEVVSTAIAHLVSGDVALRGRPVRIIDGVLTVVLPMMLAGMLAWRRSLAGLLAAAVIVLAWVVATSVAFSSGIWLNAALPIAAMAPPTILFGAFQLWSGRRQAQYFAKRSRLLESFQAPNIQQSLIRNPDFLAEPVHQDAAIIFIDLSGFTSLSEGSGGAEIRALLKEFHALIDQEVASCRGTIMTFLGDGAMILFGLPEPDSDDPVRATDCAAKLCAATERWLASLPEAIASNLGFKVGAQFGPVVASRLGGKSYHHITATGDTVNVSSRLMEVAAGRGYQLAVGEELLQAAGPDCALLKTGSLSGPHECPIRGRTAPITAWLWTCRSVTPKPPAE